MGYETFTDAGSGASELWIQYRKEFPVTETMVYLNHASISPLSRRAAEAMKDFANDALLHGSNDYSQWLDAYKGLRVAAARLINADPSEIAIVKNTSEGISTVANGMDWKPGDKIVAFREEFPSNYFPWLRLECKGVSIEWLSVNDPLERIEEAARGARLLAISFVQYLGGYRADLQAIGEICHHNGVFFFVDAIQGLGAFPLDVRACRIDALSADGHKWMTGPEGCGILYVRREVQDAIEPTEFGWTNVAGYTDYACRDMTLRQDAGRYECGSLNTIGVFGLRASLEFLLEVGIERIAPAVRNLGDRLAVAVTRRGYQLLQERTPDNSAGIVSFRREDMDSRMVVKQLAEAGFKTAPRQGWVRASPHFYIDPEEMDRLADCLP